MCGLLSVQAVEANHIPFQQNPGPKQLIGRVFIETRASVPTSQQGSFVFMEISASFSFEYFLWLPLRGVAAFLCCGATVWGVVVQPATISNWGDRRVAAHTSPPFRLPKIDNVCLVEPNSSCPKQITQAGTPMRKVKKPQLMHRRPPLPASE